MLFDQHGCIAPIIRCSVCFPHITPAVLRRFNIPIMIHSAEGYILDPSTCICPLFKWRWRKCIHGYTVKHGKCAALWGGSRMNPDQNVSKTTPNMHPHYWWYSDQMKAVDAVQTAAVVLPCDSWRPGDLLNSNRIAHTGEMTWDSKSHYIRGSPLVARLQGMLGGLQSIR